MKKTIFLAIALCFIILSNAQISNTVDVASGNLKTILSSEEVQAEYSENGWTENSGKFIDTRDNHLYNWVRIGEQVWMAENLAYLPSVSQPTQISAIPYYYVYDYYGTSVISAKATSDYYTYGVLYNWLAATKSCPSGWHLPSISEWDILRNALGGPYIAGKEMKSISGWNNNGGGTNKSGFNALAGGFSDGGFVDKGVKSFWWSSNSNSLGAQVLFLTYENDWATIQGGDGIIMYAGACVRCVKDDPNTTPAKAIIFGIIKNSVTGLPVQGAIVKTLTYHSTPTDVNGKYVLEVPFGYGYKLNVLSPSFETVTIPDIHVPKSNPTKEVNIQLVPSAIEPEIVTIFPNPNPFTSTVPQGGVLHRYYKIINKNSGNPLPLIPVDVAGNQYLKTFTTDEYGIVDIAIKSEEVGDGNIGTDEVFYIISINNISLETPWIFPAYVSPRLYSRYFDGQNYLKLGGNYFGFDANLKLETGGITTLNVDESKSFLPSDLQLNRQGRQTTEIGFSIKSPGWKNKIGTVTGGIIAEAGASLAFTGIIEDEYVFPYNSVSENQAIAKYILFADGNPKLLCTTLSRLLTKTEQLFSDNDATLVQANKYDAVGTEVVPNVKAQVLAGVGVGKNIKFGLFGDVGVEAHGGTMSKFNHLENQVETSFSLSGRINYGAAGLKLNFGSDPIFYGIKTRFHLLEKDISRGFRFTAIKDYGKMTTTKEFRITFLSRNLIEKWEEETEYRITGDQLVDEISYLMEEINQITNAPLTGMDIILNANTFKNLITNVFIKINDFQNSNNGETDVSYTVKRTDLSKISAFDLSFEASATALAANVGAGISIEEGNKMIVEKGKWIRGEHFINEEYKETIPTVPVEYESVIKKIIIETPKWIRATMGVVKILTFPWLKSTNAQYSINDNGSFIEIPSGAIPVDFDTIAVTSWSWYDDSPTLKSASLTSRQQSIAQKNRLRAEAIYGMQYGIGGFYQFEPYGIELLDTCFLTIKYDPVELGNMDENSLGMYWEDKQNKKWVYIGGVVDIVNHSVTTPITHLSLFTLAPAMPYGEFGMHATPDSIYADSISVTTILSDSIFNNDHSLVKDGSLFTIGLSLGRIVDSDSDPITEGIQLPVQNGKLTFQVKSYQLAGVAKVQARSIDGSAIGSTEITYYDTIPPSTPAVISAQLENMSVNLKWVANSEEDLAGYVVYYDTDTIFPYDGVHTVYGVSSPIIIGVDSLISISGLLNDSIYYFAVSAYDASGNESSLSSFVKVKTNFTNTCYLLKFSQGWNIFSSPNVPDSLEIKFISQPLLGRSSLIKIQDEAGNSLEDWGIFGGWKNNIGNLSPTEGYKIKLSKADSMEVCGSPVKYPFAIPLKSGWNVIGYPQLTAYVGLGVVQQLIDRGTLIKVQDEGGNSIEDWGIFGSWKNNIGNFMSGEGYNIKVSADDTLWIYESYPKSSAVLPEIAATSHFKTAFTGNGLDHMNINLINLAESGIMEGDEIGIFDGNICVGSSKIVNRNSIGIPVSASDGINGKNGYAKGNTITLKLYRNGREYPLTIQPINQGKTVFEKGESLFTIVDLATGLEGIPVSGLTEIKVYPNPTTGMVNIEFTGTGRKAEVLVTNLVGAEIFRKEITDAANYQIDLSNQGSGVYLLKISNNNRRYISKIVVSKQK